MRKATEREKRPDRFQDTQQQKLTAAEARGVEGIAGGALRAVFCGDRAAAAALFVAGVGVGRRRRVGDAVRDAAAALLRRRAWRAVLRTCSRRREQQGEQGGGR